MNNKIIKFYNRDNNIVELHYLNDITENTFLYKLVLSSESMMRCRSLSTDSTYEYFEWIDPSGGPMICIGMEVDNNLIIGQIRINKTLNYKDTYFEIMLRYTGK